VFSAAVGLAEPGGGQLLAYGNMAFNAFGPRNELTNESLRQAAEVGAWIAGQCAREALTADGLGARIYASVDDGMISAAEAALLVRSLLTAGVDTTVIGLGCALDCLAREASQWQLLRDDPGLAGAAFELSGFASLPLTLRPGPGPARPPGPATMPGPAPEAGGSGRSRRTPG